MQCPWTVMQPAGARALPVAHAVPQFCLLTLQPAVVQAPPAALRNQVCRDVCGAAMREGGWMLHVSMCAHTFFLRRGSEGPTWPCCRCVVLCADHGPCVSGEERLRLCGAGCGDAVLCAALHWCRRAACVNGEVYHSVGGALFGGTDACVTAGALCCVCLLLGSLMASSPSSSLDCLPPCPCFAGAHNTIVTSRAGKDLISCLVRCGLADKTQTDPAQQNASRFMLGAARAACGCEVVLLRQQQRHCRQQGRQVAFGSTVHRPLVPGPHDPRTHHPAADC